MTATDSKDSALWMDLTVHSVVLLTERIAQFQIGYADHRIVPAAEAGSHIEFKLNLESGGLIHRAYSVVNPGPGKDHYEIAVQREDAGGGGSLLMHKLLSGITVHTALPRNNFALVEDAKHHVLIAGGIGITPILAMARTLAERGGSFQLDYLARDKLSAAYVEDVKALSRGTCWFDGGLAGSGLNLKAHLSIYTPGHHVYVCGPKGLVSAVVEAAKSAGWPAQTIHYELFAGALDRMGDRPFRVRIKDSATSYEVPPGQTILEVLEAAGEPVMADCRRGECGVCITKVVSGTPDHRDVSLSFAERASGGWICPCVSRCLSDELILDL